MRGFWIATGVAALAACAHNVPQDANTGADGKLKGARPLRLDNGEGLARGIVTYPGGDRVDWKSIELPAGKHGTLALALTYTTPRPGLHVAFDVFDAYQAPVKLATEHRRKRGRDAQIDGASGTYYVRVFAPMRGDAGTYKLKATFTEDYIEPAMNPIEVPDPPKLAAVPPPPLECPDGEYDPRNPACKGKCPATPQPNMAIDCPHAIIETAPWAGPAATTTAATPPIAQPVRARVIAVQQFGDTLQITIAAGTAQQVDETWTLRVLSGESDAPLANGAGKLVRVGKLSSVATVKLSQDQLSANQRVLLSPPAPASK